MAERTTWQKTAGWLKVAGAGAALVALAYLNGDLDRFFSDRENPDTPPVAAQSAAPQAVNGSAPPAAAKAPAPKEAPSRSVPSGFCHGSGTVVKLLADDLEPPRHQRFIIKLPDRSTLLVVHNIDIAPRLNSIRSGDTVEYCGEFIDNDKGGLVHWTHRDPSGRRKGGWLKHNGRFYE